MEEYIIEPKSREELRELAYAFRKDLGLENQIYFPVVEVLEVLPTLYGINYEIIDDCETPKDIHAYSDVVERKIYIKESVYNGACEGIGRDRMSVAHEFGHSLTICVCKFRIEKYEGQVSRAAFRCPERQAKCFAGELLVPAYLTKGFSKEEIAERCGVSTDAASVQYCNRIIKYSAKLA